MQLALLVPGRTTFSASPDHGLCNDPTTLHGRHIDDIKSLGHRNSICPISFHNHSIFTVQFHPIFLIENVEWDLFTIMSWHPQLFAFKLTADNLRTKQFDLPLHSFSLACMVVGKLLLVDERRFVGEGKLVGFVVLVNSGVDLTNIVFNVYGIEGLAVQILNKNFWLSIPFAINRDEVFKTIELRDHQIIGTLLQVQIISPLR